MASYQILGEGPAITFIHGFCLDSRIWDSVASAFLPNYKIVLIDLPGFGASTQAGCSSIEAMADAVEAILTQEKISETLLVGHSMGGYIGLELWNRSVRMRGLAMIHSHPFSDTSTRIQEREKQIQFIERHGVETYIRTAVPSFFPKAFVQAQPRLIKDLIDQYKQVSKGVVINGIKAMMHREDHRQTLLGITAPVLFFIGQEDALVPHEYSMQQVSLPSISLLQLRAGLGHMGMFESPQSLIAALHKWIQLCDMF